MIDTYNDFKINSVSDFKKIIKGNKRNAPIIIPYDIETFTTNRSAKKPSQLQTYPYSVCFSIIKNKSIYLYIFPSFKDTINFILSNTNKKIKLIFTAHNCNKYDNHFFRYSLINDFNLIEKNLYKKNITKELPNHTILSKEKDNVILSSRVKSSTNLTFTAKINNLTIITDDTYPRTNLPLLVLAKKLNHNNLLDKKYLKTSYNYLKYDRDNPVTYLEHFAISKQIFDNLTKEELIYIFNDVIILSYLIIYFNVIYPDFDYQKSTFMQNVKTAYETNPLTLYQLECKDSDNNKYFEYDNYVFNNLSLYSYYQKFFRGGLNIYNDKYLSQYIDDCFSIDINSSYSYVIYTQKFPFEIFEYSETPTLLNIKNEKVRKNDIIYYIEISKTEMNNILSQINSFVIKKMIVKYYHEDLETSNIYISSILLNALAYLFNYNIDLTSIKCISYISYTTKFFGNRDKISDFYYIKTQGKNKYVINYNSPTDITLTKDINNNQLSPIEVSQSKVYLNGIFGLPALRKYFDYFYVDTNSINSLPSGFENTERNILFSATVTMYAFVNLITPLSYFKGSIDDYFVYADTDSLYLKKEAYSYLPKSIFSPYNLGSWDIEHENITTMFVLNHKKYALLDNSKIIIRCAGVPLSSFNTNTTFENFIENQFLDGVKIDNQRSILNEDLTISIYTAKTEFKQGIKYNLYYNNIHKKEIINTISTSDLDCSDNLLYIETSDGNFSKRDIDFTYLNDTKERLPIKYLKLKQEYLEL